MSEVTFPYVHQVIPPSTPYPQGQTARRPLVVATITAETGKSLRCAVCVDTGADQCIFPLVFATALGIDILTLPRNNTGGVGTTANITYYAPLTVDIGQGVSFSCQVGFTSGMDVHGIGLIGQDGFFSKYDCHFSHMNSTLTVTIP